MDATQREPHSPSTPPSEASTLLVWSTMRDLYGGLWSSEYGKTPTPAWKAALRGLSGEEIRRGLRAAVDGGRRFPPTAPEFRALCRPPERANREQRAFYAMVDEGDRHVAALPSPEALAAKGGTVGRRWWAFWNLEGLRPPAPNVDGDALDAMLEGADVERMRARVRFYTDAIRRCPHQGPIPEFSQDQRSGPELDG